MLVSYADTVCLLRAEGGEGERESAESLKCSMGERGGAGGLRLRQSVGWAAQRVSLAPFPPQKRHAESRARGWHGITHAQTYDGLRKKIKMTPNSRFLTACGWRCCMETTRAAFYAFHQRAEAIKTISKFCSLLQDQHVDPKLVFC